jgi:hypothetical protein
MPVCPAALESFLAALDAADELSNRRSVQSAVFPAFYPASGMADTCTFDAAKHATVFSACCSAVLSAVHATHSAAFASYHHSIICPYCATDRPKSACCVVSAVADSLRAVLHDAK